MQDAVSMAPDSNIDDDEGHEQHAKAIDRGGDAGAAEEADFREAVTRHAKYLGIDPDYDAGYMWIAEEVWHRCC